jgi:hypothetical protein
MRISEKRLAEMIEEATVVASTIRSSSPIGSP